MALGEFELIKSFFGQNSDQEGLVLGLGDDAAVIASKNRLAIATDTLVEGVHFPESSPAELIARRAIRVNLSDMAAMGATPRWFTLSLTLPVAKAEWLKSFSRGLFEDARAFNCALIGGDTTQGPLNIGIQMLGEFSEAQGPLVRSGAQPGDLIAVTGTLGDAGAALETDLLAYDQGQGLGQRYWLPEPRIAFASRASHLIHAAIDISDGLVADAGHLCQQSKLGARINLQTLPVSQMLSEHWADQARVKALCAGDDYELCIAIAPEKFQRAEAIAAECGHTLTQVGQFDADINNTDKAIKVLDDGRAMDIASQGYTHF